MADEEPVDQKKYLEDSCKPKCVKPFLQYQGLQWYLSIGRCVRCYYYTIGYNTVCDRNLLKDCVKRIQGDESGHKHCTGQYFDYWSCVDKCVAPKLFSKLK